MTSTRALPTENLLKLSDFELQKKIIEIITAKVHKDGRGNYEIIPSLSHGQQMAYSTWWLEAEVDNGGFSQYFWNSVSRLGKQAYHGYKLIGATDYATLVGKALTRYVKNFDSFKNYQNERTHEGFKKFQKVFPCDDIDKEFYALEDKVNVNKLRSDYIRAHLEEFQE